MTISRSRHTFRPCSYHYPNTFSQHASREPHLTISLKMKWHKVIFSVFYLVLTAVVDGSFDIKSLEGCDHNGPLGMIMGEIQDWQITASSTYPQEWDKGCHERYGRVYQPNGLGWCAKYKSSSEWLQVDLGVAAKITGVMTQGRGDGAEWVTSFMVSYSMDAFHWQYVSDQYGNQRVFEGNTDSYAVKHSYLDRPITARFIKFHTVHWNKHPSMRVEIIGCQVCKTFIALPPYGKLSASSEKSYKQGSSCLADDGHIMTNKGWCSQHNNANQWLQFDVGPPTLITGIVTKGRGDTGRKNWVTRFRLSYSNDSKVWYYYKDASHLDPKRQLSWTMAMAGSDNSSANMVIPDRQGPDGVEFGGNVDKNMERYHYLNSPFVSRFVRFHPIDWHNHISMRAGMLGCPYKGSCDKGFMRINGDTPCVENMAYKKESWINNKRQYKRHIRNRWMHGHASRAVDGDYDQSLHSCTILDNFYVEKPIWMVDLGKKTHVAGVVIVTWQGHGQVGAGPAKAYGNPAYKSGADGSSQNPRTSYRDYMYNLDKLAVYVDTKGGKSQIDLPVNMCGFISRLNDALFKPRLHIQCLKPITGRYLYIEAWGVPNRWSRLFSAVLCEVMVYS